LTFVVAGSDRAFEDGETVGLRGEMAQEEDGREEAGGGGGVLVLAFAETSLLAMELECVESW
jgi:hypothetical protein